MTSRWLDDPWRVIQIYALLIALLVAVVGVVRSTGSAGWSEDDRPVVHVVRLDAPPGHFVDEVPR